VVSVSSYVASNHVKNPAGGEPPQGAYLKLARFPFETLTQEAADDGDLPIEPKWLGLWLGDGLHSDTMISSSDLDETRYYLAGYVDRLNATRPAGAAPLHLRITPKIFAEDHPVHSNVTIFDFAISSTFHDNPGFPSA
jgi:hypothetical protein